MCRLGYLCYNLVVVWFCLLVPAKWLVGKMISKTTYSVSSWVLKPLYLSVCLLSTLQFTSALLIWEKQFGAALRFLGKIVSERSIAVYCLHSSLSVWLLLHILSVCNISSSAAVFSTYLNFSLLSNFKTYLFKVFSLSLSWWCLFFDWCWYAPYA